MHMTFLKFNDEFITPFYKHKYIPNRYMVKLKKKYVHITDYGKYTTLWIKHDTFSEFKISNSNPLESFHKFLSRIKNTNGETKQLLKHIYDMDKTWLS